MKVRFEVVAIRGQRRWKDSQCKWHQETQKFWQTISPFNTDSDGHRKTREEIMKELIAERQLWLSTVKNSTA